jgi:hypothetical protein
VLEGGERDDQQRFTAETLRHMRDAGVLRAPVAGLRGQLRDSLAGRRGSIAAQFAGLLGAIRYEQRRE